MTRVAEYEAGLAELEKGLSFLNRGGSRPAGLALSALAAWRKGDGAQALSLLAQAAAGTPEPWPRLLQAEVLRSRAAAQEALGEMPLAVADAAEAARLCPCAEHHLFHSQLLGGWREYDQAAEACGKALELSPGRADLMLQRSRLLSAAGRIEEALADAERALERAPEGEDALFHAAQLEVQLGRGEAARARVRALAATRARANFALAYADLREGKTASALAHLDAAVGLSEDERGKAKAAFYRTLATAGLPESAPALPGVTLIGLGLNPPFTATLQQLRALSGCDLALSNVAGEEVFELLRLFCGDCRPLPYHQDSDEERLAARLLAAARDGRRVAFVTRGHAAVYGPLGGLLMRRCRREGVPFRCLASVSSADVVVARHGQDDPGLAQGFRVLDSRVPAESLAPTGVPTLLTLGDDIVGPGPGASRFQRTRFRALCAALARYWGPSRPCRVFPLRVDLSPLVTPVRELEGFSDRLEYSAVLYLRDETAETVPAPVPACAREGVVLLGLGVEPLEHATLETLQAAASCDVLFCEGLGPQAREFLRRFCLDTRELAAGAEASVLEAARAGLRAGLATRHHPFLFTETGRSLVRACARTSIPWSSLPAVSPLGVELAEAGKSLGEDVLAVRCERAATTFAAVGLLLGALTLGAAAAPAELEVRLSPAVELGQVVQLLGSRERRFQGFESRPGWGPAREAAERFRPLQGHPAVSLTAALEQRGFSAQERIKRLALLGDPPELADPEPPGNWYGIERAGPEMLARWLAALRAFAKRGDFSAYFAGEERSLRPTLDALRSRLEAADPIGAHRRYTGIPYKARYRLILSPYMQPGVSINHLQRRDDGSFVLYSVGGPGRGSDGAPDFSDPDALRLPHTFWHELSHGALDSLADRYGAQIERSAALWKKLPRPCYGDWRQCVREHLVRAVKNRLLLQERGEAAARADLEDEEGRGYLYLKPLTDRLQEFEAHRDRYPSLVEFYPRWIAALDGIAAAPEPAR